MKGKILRQSISVWLLLLLIIAVPRPAKAQTRLFKPGDSGVSATIDWQSWRRSNYTRRSTLIRAAFTYKGLWDIGIGYGEPLFYMSNGWLIYANYALINPKPAQGVGLEIRGRYDLARTDKYPPPIRGYFIPDYKGARYRTFQPGLRGFFRNSKSDLVIGVEGFYRFRNSEILDMNDEVLIGSNYGELGFALDVQGRQWNWLHLSISAQYSQNNRVSDEWYFTTTFNLGFFFGYSSENGDKDHEQ